MKPVDLLTMCMAIGLLCSTSAASAQQSAAQRCLDALKPVLRNEDGSLSPNPAFDECLRNPLVTAPPARSPAQAPRTTPVPVVAPMPMPIQTAAPVPLVRTWQAASNAPVEATLRAWLPPGWQLRWDTTASPRGPELSVTGDLMAAIKALASTRRQWTESPSLLQVLVFKADRIVQVREAPAPLPDVQTESLTGATP
ncbi:hypothetical protein [Stenotrophomonas maltophilia]